jgi:hypothetical protein
MGGSRGVGSGLVVVKNFLHLCLDFVDNVRHF